MKKLILVLSVFILQNALHSQNAGPLPMKSLVTVCDNVTLVFVDGSQISLCDTLHSGKVMINYNTSCLNQDNFDYLPTLKAFYDLHGPAGDNTVQLIIWVGVDDESNLNGLGDTAGNWVEQANGAPIYCTGEDSLNTFYYNSGPAESSKRFTLFYPDNKSSHRYSNLSLTGLEAAVNAWDKPTGEHNAAALQVLADTFTNCLGQTRLADFWLSNNGEADITSATIGVSWKGQEYKTINWTGNLKKFHYAVIEDIEGIADGQGGDWAFYIKSVNGVTDQEQANDTIKHYISPAAAISSNEIVVSWKTHSAPSYVYWDVIDDEGNYLIRIGDSLIIQTSNSGEPDILYSPGTVYNFPLDLSNYGETCLTLRTFTVMGTNPGYYLNIIQGTDTLASIKEQTGLDRYAARNLYTTFVETAETKVGLPLLLFPNPANELVMIAFESDHTDEVEISCYNLLGQLMKNQRYQALIGDNTLLLEISSLSSGVYYISLKGNQSNGSAQLVIRK